MACSNRFLLYEARATWCKTSWHFLSSKFCSICFPKYTFLSSKFQGFFMKAVKIHNTSSRYPVLSSFRIAVDLTLSHLCVRLRYLNFSSPLGSGEGTLVAVVYSCFVSDNLYFSLLYLPSEYYMSNG